MGRGSGSSKTTLEQSRESDSGSGDEQRSWFNHVCWYCGHKSRQVDLIVGDGVYQCWFSNRDECEQRRQALTPLQRVRLPKPFHLS